MSKVQQSSAVLLENAGRYFFYQPEIGIIASDDTVEAAYATFTAARQKYYAEMAEAGLDVPVRPEVVAQRRIFGSLGRELGLFFARIAVVIIVVATLGFGVALGVRSGVDRLTDMIAFQIDTQKPISMKDVVKKAEDVARDMRDLTDKQKETLRQSVGTISRELAPAFDAWRNPPSVPASSSGEDIEKVAPDQIITHPEK